MTRNHRITLPALALDGPQLQQLTPAPSPLRLRGVNLSGLEYDPHAASRILAALPEITAAWRANVIRVPFNQDWVLRSEDYLESIDLIVAAAAERGAYTILDLQWLHDEMPYGGDNFVPPLPIPASLDMWRELAQRYRGNPHLIFDLFNEPHDPLPGDPHPLVDPAGNVFEASLVTHAHWREWAAALAAAVQDVDPERIMMVSGVNWGYDLAGFPLEMPNILYSTHVYPERGDGWWEAFGHLAGRVPLIAGEWGFSGDDPSWGKRVLRYFDTHALHWCAWSWFDHPHLQVGGRPTAFGALVRSALS